MKLAHALALTTTLLLLTATVARGQNNPYDGNYSDPYGEAPKAKEAAPSPPVETKVYDVATILDSMMPTTKSDERDRGGGGGFGDGGGGGKATDARSTAETSLFKALTTVDIETWQANGGQFGTAWFVGDKLVVTQTPDVQAKVAELLKSLGDRRTVSVRAMIAAVNDAGASLKVDKGVTLFTGDAETLSPFVQTRYTTYDGRQRTVAQTWTIPYVADVTPVVANNAVGYRLTMGQVEAGTTLTLTATTGDDGKTVSLAAKCEYVAVPSADTAGKEKAKDAVPVANPPPVFRYSLDTSLRGPTGQWIVVGSLGKFSDGTTAPAAAYLLLVRVDAQ